jgi:hypothetical protein
LRAVVWIEIECIMGHRTAASKTRFLGFASE